MKVGSVVYVGIESSVDYFVMVAVSRNYAGSVIIGSKRRSTGLVRRYGGDVVYFATGIVLMISDFVVG